MTMETPEFIEALRADGVLLADLAEKAGWDADVATCPDWKMRDLVGHLGNVHRWAAGYVAGATEFVPPTDTRPADDAGMAAWFREGHGALVEALTAAPADRECWTFIPAPTPIGFWARRQAHETAVHRVDAESALMPAANAPISADFALDGIDELLCGIHTGGRNKVRAETPCTLRIRATDGSGRRDWLLRLSQDPLVVEDDDTTDADCTISGPASTLYLALWNRTGYEGTEVTGDASLADLWRRTSAI